MSCPAHTVERSHRERSCIDRLPAPHAFQHEFDT
jgi:hypothetical protein